MEAALPTLRQLAGNIAMPGFTAPKIAWVRKHEPEIYSKLAKVLLPKAYIRLLMSGDYVEEMSDASGTLWLDVAKRDWSDALLGVTGLNRSHMPRLVEGSAPSGTLTMHDKRYPVAATGNGNKVTGTFESDGSQFEFSATLDSGTMSLESGGNTYTLKKATSKPLGKTAPKKPLGE